MASVEELKSSSYVSHSFRLEWKIPLKTFSDYNPVPRPIPKDFESPRLEYGEKVIEISREFDLKDIKMGPFYLALIQRNSPRIFCLKLITKVRNLKIEYAFVCLNDLPLYLDLSNKDPPDYMKDQPFLKSVAIKAYSEFSDLTIFCGISAYSCMDFFTPDMVSNDPENIVPMRGCSISIPNIRSSSWSTSTSSTGSEAFAKYVRGGELPTLNIDLAKDLLRVTSDTSYTDLKALCVQYLEKNLSSGNIAGVLQTACELNIKYLMEKCNNFLRRCYISESRNEGLEYAKIILTP